MDARRVLLNAREFWCRIVFNCIVSWLQLPGPRSIMIVKGALHPIPLWGLRAVVQSNARLTLELMSTLLGYLALQVFARSLGSD